jgi:two-component system nitrogen regulation sensor histidine kinase GlnL
MNPLSLSAFFTALTSLTLAGLVFLKKGKEKISFSYALLSLSFFVWVFGIGMEIGASSKYWGFFWNRWLYSGAIFLPTFYIQFVQHYLNRTNRRILASCYVISISLLIFNFTGLFVRDVVPKGSFNYASVPGIVFPFFVLYFFLAIICSFYFIIKEYKTSIGIKRNQLKFLMLASLIGFSGGSTNFLLVFEIFYLPPIGNYFIAIGLFILFYAIVRRQDINIVLAKWTTYVLMTLLLLVPSITLIIIGQKYFYNRVDYFFSTIVFSIILLVTICFPKIKPLTEKVVEQFLFKDRYDYRDTLARFSKALVTILNLQSLSKRIIETVTHTMGVDKASLFSLNEERGGFYLLESKNIKIDSFPPILTKGDPLPQYLQKMKEIVIREELIKGAAMPEIKEVVNTMSRLEAEVSIPLISKGQLIGMINLSHKFNKDIYSHEDIELLSMLANQTTIAIENARLYDDLKRSKSYIRRADRLASLGTLTAGLAHEIRNPLVAIKTFTQLLPERIDDDEFRNHFLSIASGEVDRISALVTELLEFARPSEPKFEVEDINSILDGMILLVFTEMKSKHIDIVKDYASDLSPITIDREQMKQVFLNMLLNAIEATPEKGKIYVRTRSYTKPEGETYIQIEFTDTGCGIRPEYLEDIFTPFFTTKEKGSGLGLSISNQIVQDHRGYIDVESQVNKGASFFINLPLHHLYPKRRKSDFESQPPLIHPIGRP